MNFNQDKLNTNFMTPATSYDPIVGRKYTLTHSDITGDLFLDIGCEYNYDAIDLDMRDELLGVIKSAHDNIYNLFFYAYVEDEDYEVAAKKYEHFKRNMDLALQAIIYGDRLLFEKYPYLVNTPIFVKFDSNFDIFNNYENYGYIKDYL